MTNQLKRMTVDIANETVRRMVPLGATTYSADSKGLSEMGVLSGYLSKPDCPTLSNLKP